MFKQHKNILFTQKFGLFGQIYLYTGCMNELKSNKAFSFRK